MIYKFLPVGKEPTRKYPGDKKGERSSHPLTFRRDEVVVWGVKGTGPGMRPRLAILQ